MLHRDKAPLEVGSLYWELRDSVVNCELMMLRILQFHVAFNNPHKVPKFNPPPQACCLVFNFLSLRGRPSKGKGKEKEKGIRARDHAPKFPFPLPLLRLDSSRNQSKLPECQNMIYPFASYFELMLIFK